MKNQLTRGLNRRLMYVENKDGDIDGAPARIGWVEFSKTGRTVRYRGRELMSIGGRGVRGNFMDAETREEYWVSGVKQRGSNIHGAERLSVEIDSDAVEAYRALRFGAANKRLRIAQLPFGTCALGLGADADFRAVSELTGVCLNGRRRLPATVGARSYVGGLNDRHRNLCCRARRS